MNKILNLLLLFALTATACNTESHQSDDADDKETTNEKPAKKKGGENEQMAADVCGCVTPHTNTLSGDAKRVFSKALNSDDVEQATREELLKLDEADRIKVSAELEVMGNAFESEDSGLNTCMDKVSKKYKNEPDDPEKAIRQLVDAMQDIKDCELGALIFKAYMTKGMDETDDTPVNDDEAKGKEKSNNKKEK
jgi:hypothetical protein